MWLITNQGFTSAVQDRNDPDSLFVRARVKDDLKPLVMHAFARKSRKAWESYVTTSSNSDYAFRTHVTKRQFADFLADQALGIDYTNFKNSVKSKPHHHAYMEIWTVLSRLQPWKPWSGGTWQPWKRETRRDLRTPVGDGIAVKPLGHTPPSARMPVHVTVAPKANQLVCEERGERMSHEHRHDCYYFSDRYPSVAKAQSISLEEFEDGLFEDDDVVYPTETQADESKTRLHS